MDLSLERNCSRHRVACTEISSTGGIKPRFALAGAIQGNFYKHAVCLNVETEPWAAVFEFWTLGEPVLRSIVILKMDKNLSVY